MLLHCSNLTGASELAVLHIITPSSLSSLRRDHPGCYSQSCTTYRMMLGYRANFPSLALSHNSCVHRNTYFMPPHVSRNGLHPLCPVYLRPENNSRMTVLQSASSPCLIIKIWVIRTVKRRLRRRHASRIHTHHYRHASRSPANFCTE